MFFQFCIVWLFVLQTSEVDAWILGLDEVIMMCEAVSLYFLPNFMQKLVVNGLKKSVMCLPKQILASVAKLNVTYSFFCTVLESLHKKNPYLYEGKIRGYDFSQFVFIQSDEVDAITQVVCSFNDIQIFRRNKIFFLEPLHASIQIVIIECFYFLQQRLYWNSLFSRLFHEDGVSQRKDSLIEDQLFSIDKIAWILFLEYIYGVAISFVDIFIHILQADGPFHSKQM